MKTFICLFILCITNLSLATTKLSSQIATSYKISGLNSNLVSQETLIKQLGHDDQRGAYYAWGRGQNGWGYCYQWTQSGQVLNGGQPVPDYNCEDFDPSYFNWGRGQNGYGYCYQWTPHGVPMNEGRAFSNSECEYYNPSYYAWGRAQNGNTYCYQRTPKGLALNEGQPVANHYCY